MYETILVTAATSNIGREVVKQLYDKYDNIVIKSASRSMEDNAFENLNITLIHITKLDYKKQDTITSVIRGIDKLFLLTPFQSDMVDLTANLLKEVKKNTQLKHIVKLSVWGSGTFSKSIPFVLHREAEKLVEETGTSFARA